MEESKQKKKRLISFHFGIRKEMLTNLMVIVVMIGLMIALMPVIGTNNALTVSMSLIAVLMTLKNDYSVQPVKNTILFFVTQVGLGALAYLASLNSIAMVLISLGVTFFVVYIFTSENKQSIYMPLLLNFVMMLYYPVAGVDLLIRLSILAGSALLIMLLQMLLNKNKFRKKIAKGVSDTILLMNQQVNAIAVGEDKEQLQTRAETIAKALAGISGAMDSRLPQVGKWQEGRYYLKTVMTLERINRILTEAYLERKDELDEATYQALKEFLEALVPAENQGVDRELLREKLQGFYHQIGKSYVSYELKEEVDTFLKGEVEEYDLPEHTMTFAEKFKSYFNGYHLIFAAKTAVLSALGVMVVEIFQLPSGYMLPLTIAIATQPYLELSTKSGCDRLLHTFYAVVMFFLSFSITDMLWLHVLILLAFLVVGDMFLQFNFTVLYGTLMSLVMGVISARDTVANLSIYRFGYVAVACLALMLLDRLFFPRRLDSSMRKYVQTSVSLNDTLIQELLKPDSSYQSVRHIVMEIRTVNQNMQMTNQYIKSPEINQYLMHEKKWTIRLLILLHELSTSNISREQLQPVLSLAQERPDAPENLDALPQEQQKILLLSVREILREMKQAPECVASFLQPATAQAKGA